MKKFLNLKSILCCVAAVFGLIAALMLFAPAIVPKFGSEGGYKGSEIAFGKTVLGYGLAPSAYMLPLFLAAIGVVLSLLAFLGKGGKIAPVLAAICFLGAAVCYFLPFQMITPKLGEEKLDSEELKLWRDYMKEIGDLGAGAIVGGVFSIIAACAVAVPLFLKSGNSAE